MPQHNKLTFIQTGLVKFTTAWLRVKQFIWFLSGESFFWHFSFFMVTCSWYESWDIMWLQWLGRKKLWYCDMHIDLMLRLNILTSYWNLCLRARLSPLWAWTSLSAQQGLEFADKNTRIKRLHLNATMTTFRCFCCSNDINSTWCIIKHRHSVEKVSAQLTE